MTLEKTAKFAGDWRTILSFCSILFVGAVWAADTRYVTHQQAELVAKRAEIRQLRMQIQDLEIQKGYSEDEQKRKMFDARIKVKENQIKQIEGE